MEGVFAVKDLKHGQGVTCFGYYTDEGSLESKARKVQDAGEPGRMLDSLVEQDEAYHVEVFRDADGAHYVRLRSGNRHAAAKVENRLETVESGLDSTLAMGTGEPGLPDQYDDPHRAIEMYARYALEHGAGNGVSGEFDWEEMLEEGTR